MNRCGGTAQQSSIWRSDITSSLIDALQLNKDDIDSIMRLTQSIVGRFAHIEEVELLEDLPVLAQSLPLRVRQKVNAFRLDDSQGMLILRGLPVNEVEIGLTPPHWREETFRGRTFPNDVCILLIASLLGEPFSWGSQQNANLVQEIFPVREDEHEQLGTGSRALLNWHTEDAFSPFRADYVLLMALRNPDRVATTIGGLSQTMITRDLYTVLFEPRYHIIPDGSHLSSTSFNAEPGPGSRLNSTLVEPVAVLFGDHMSPYLRVDPVFMRVAPDDTHAALALDELKRVIDMNLCSVTLGPGDIGIMNNYRIVHGRQPFEAHYDGQDRWLKLVNITRDLRKSRSQRSSALSRVVG